MLTFRASAKWPEPLDPRPLSEMLSTEALVGADSVNSSQFIPNGRFDSVGSILNVLQCRVDFEHVSKVLCALSLKRVVRNTASKQITSMHYGTIPLKYGVMGS